MMQENVFLDTRNISYELISGVSSELNEFFGSDVRIKSYTHFAEDSIYKIQIELNDEDSPKHVLVREIFGSSSECVGSKNIELLTNIEKAYIFLYYFFAKKTLYRKEMYAHQKDTQNHPECQAYYYR